MMGLLGLIPCVSFAQHTVIKRRSFSKPKTEGRKVTPKKNVSKKQANNSRRPTPKTSNSPTKAATQYSNSGKYSDSGMKIPEAVDLGLSVKWASFNLGATKPEEYGYYYKWGETRPSDNRGESTYNYDKSYVKDSKLRTQDDAATMNLGGMWLMPTFSEVVELIDKCEHEWTTVKGINGIRVTGTNGKSIFFPASGYRSRSNGSLYDVGSYGYYWSASAYSYGNCCSLYFNSGYWCWLFEYYRAYGFPVRPVLSE